MSTISFSYDSFLINDKSNEVVDFDDSERVIYFGPVDGGKYKLPPIEYLISLRFVVIAQIYRELIQKIAFLLAGFSMVPDK